MWREKLLWQVQSFDYSKYVRGIPLLKEDIKEITEDGDLPPEFVNFQEFEKFMITEFEYWMEDGTLTDLALYKVGQSIIKKFPELAHAVKTSFFNSNGEHMFE